ERWLAALRTAPLAALDTDTTSREPMRVRLVGLSLSIVPGKACYIPVGHRGPDQVQQLPRQEVLERLRPWLENPDAPKLLHNAIYDAHVLLNEGVRLAAITEDTMLQSYVLESHRRVGMQ